MSETLDTLTDTIVWIHIVAGFIGLGAFWIPIFARKGGTWHRGAGKVFKVAAWTVLTISAVAVLLRATQLGLEGTWPRERPNAWSTLVFLGYLTLVTGVALRHGLRALRFKNDVSAMNAPLDRALARAAIASSALLVAWTLVLRPGGATIVLLALSPIGYGMGRDILAVLRGGRLERRAWFYEHMGAMLGVGIAFHTAFAVFGATRLFDLGLEGWPGLLPWVLPAAIGIPASWFWTRHYMRRFGDLPA